MLDMNGFASECNGTNLFVVHRGELLTPHADSCLPGITRRKVIALARGNDIGCMERNISISEVYSADEVFVTGSMGELTPVLEVDGRRVGDEPGSITHRIQKLFRSETEVGGTMIPR